MKKEPNSRQSYLLYFEKKTNKLIISATDSLLIADQQVLMLIDHPQAQVAIHCHNKLWQCHNPSIL